MIAILDPAFTESIYKFLKDLKRTNNKDTRILSCGTERELFGGDVITEAMKKGI